jgi:hypothetical protein
MLDASARHFVLWCLEALGLRTTLSTGGIHRIEPPAFSGQSAVQPSSPYADLAGRKFSFELESRTTHEDLADVEHVTLDCPLLRWLFDELRGKAWPMQAAPGRQPTSVRELADHLFAQYRIDAGSIHLSGCSLEDRPFLRLSFHDPHPAEGESQIVHCFGSSDGQLLDPQLVADLELDQLVPLVGRAPKLEVGVLEQWSEIIRQQYQSAQGVSGPSPVAATLVWCKHAEGKLAFTIGQESVEVPFTGWGRQFVDRRLVPPPYACPLTGRSSYHLAATDDGRITAAEAIATCAESLRRVLADELETCSETGRRALPEYLQVCAVSGRKVLTRVLRPCEMCRQRVSPKSLENHRCPACRNLALTAKADPRLARILDAYPKLDRWRTWKMADTRTVHVLVATSAWKRLLVVVDKQTLDVLHLAGGGRFSGSWIEATDVQRSEWIG